MNYHNITKDDMLNGDGLRVVLWVSGCAHHCRGCQNPVTWDPQDGVRFDEEAKKEIFDQLAENYISGITFSGGDPLERAEEFAYMAKAFKKAGLNIWRYTGYTFEDVLEKMKKDNNIKDLIENIDVLVDGRFEKDKKVDGLKFKGSSNQRLIDVKKSLKSNCIIVLE